MTSCRCPRAPAGKAFPTLGYGSWSMFSTTKDKDLAWKLIATLDGPEGNIEWNKRIGALPIYKSAEKDPFYADPKFKGWFQELADQNVVPTVMPTYLRGVRLLRGFDCGQDQPAGAARRDHARGDGQAMGGLPDQGPAEVPGQEEVSGLRQPAELSAVCGRQPGRRARGFLRPLAPSLHTIPARSPSRWLSRHR